MDDFFYIITSPENIPCSRPMKTQDEAIFLRDQMRKVPITQPELLIKRVYISENYGPK